MSVNTVIDFFALAVLLGVGSLLVGLAVPQLRPLVRDSAPILASVVAIGATLGSLYLSEVAGLEPCRLCWFQRIAMYPLALLIPVAVFHDRELGPHRAAVGLSVIGAGVAIYHVQLQLFPEQGSSCGLEASCTEQKASALGFMTIPQMALGCFAMIAVLLVLHLVVSRTATLEGSELHDD